MSVDLTHMQMIVFLSCYFYCDCFQETQEDDAKENLNLTATHIVGYLQKARK